MESDSNIPPPQAELKDNSSESLHLLLNTIEGINQSRGIKSVLEESMEAVRLVMNAEASSLMLLDEDTGELNICLPTGPAKKEIKGKRIPKNEGIGGWVIEKRQPYISNDVENSDIFWGEVAEEFKTRNIICVPLINRDNKAIGVLQALNKRRRNDFNPHDIPVFQALASHITMAIERVRGEEELRNRIKRQELLLADFRKRVKKNLDMVSEFIDRDGSGSDGGEIVQKITRRLDALKEIQTLLSMQERDEEVDLTGYLQKLLKKVRKLFSGIASVEVKVVGDVVKTNTEKAVSAGSLVYDLLIGIFRESVTEQQEGPILIETTEEEYERISVRLNDAGKQLLQALFESEHEHRELNKKIEKLKKQGFTIDLDESSLTIRFRK